MSSIVVDTIYGGSGGGVASVNADTGPDVVLDNTDVGAAAAAHTHAIDDLSDVTITAVATDNVMKWNGSAWVNGTGPATFADNVFRIYDSATPTKIQAFELSGLVGTRTITGVNRDITLDTLTVATEMSGFTNKGILYANSSLLINPTWALLSGSASLPTLQLGTNTGADQSGTGVNDHIYLYRNITGTPADGTGIGIRFLGKSSTTINRDMGVLECVFETATDASRQTRLDFYTYVGATKTRMLRLGASGVITIGTPSADNTVIIPTAGNTNLWIGASGLIKLVDNAGTPNIDINHGNGTLKINGTQVLQARITGWGGWSGTAQRTGLATSTATLEQVAQTLKALLDDLFTHGIIGA